MVMRSGSKLKVYGIFAIVFTLGIAAGGGTALAYAHHRHVSQIENDRIFESRRLRGLSRKLKLDSEQEDRIADILADDQQESRKIGRDVIERCGQPLRDHKAAVDAQIRAVLRPDQQQRFDKLVEERRGHVSLRHLR